MTDARPKPLSVFDPNRHLPADVGLGGLSTEVLATGQDPSGKWVNYPTLFWRDGNPVGPFDDGTAMGLAMFLERMNGATFPRFENLQDAIDAARKRSEMGGGLAGYLMQGVGP